MVNTSERMGEYEEVEKTQLQICGGVFLQTSQFSGGARTDCASLAGPLANVVVRCGVSGILRLQSFTNDDLIG